MKKLILIDGFAIMFRAFYASAYAKSGILQTKDGVYTNALVVFANLIEKISKESTGHMMIAFDTKAKTIRHETYEDYKAQRKPMPEELVMQVPLIKELVDLWGITQIGMDGYEADDVIGTVAKRASKEGIEVQIYSSDRDLLQLVDENINVNLLRRGMQDVGVYNLESLKEETGLRPSQIIDLKALMGDSSDNIIGIAGVGEKTALKLLYEYDNIDNIFANADNLKGKVGEAIRESKELVYNNKFLVTINTDVPMDDIKSNDLAIKSFDQEKLLSFYERYELRRLANKLRENISKATQNSSNGEFEELTIFNYNNDLNNEKEDKKIISDFKIRETIVLETEEAITNILKDELTLYFEFDDINYHTCDLWGVGISDGLNNYFVNKDIALSSKVFINYLSDFNYKKIVFDLKAIIVFLNRFNIKINNVVFDLMLGIYIVSHDFKKDDINSALLEFENIRLEDDEQIYGKGVKKGLPEEKNKYINHIGRKAQAIWEVYPLVNKLLETQNQSKLFYEIELPLAIILSKMEIEGILINQFELELQTKELEKTIELLEKQIHEFAGHEFNIKSVKQLGVVLFEELNLPVIKKNKTGYSTDAEVLTKLKGSHPIIDDLILYRQLIKLFDTYLVGLKKVVSSNNRIHTIYKQALTTTGRLSSIEPNLQNIPIRTEQGRLIRKIFIPNENETLLAVDYSQIELRVLAHIANVEGLIKAFENNEDIHAATAKSVFNINEVSDNERRNAKAVNFGIIYGMGAWSLSEDLNISPAEAQNFINQYLKVYPEIKDYMINIENYAKDYGYVETILNRRRYLPGINSSNRIVQQAAKRTALNTPIQGSAADILKAAMIKVDEFLTKNNYKTKMLLQVHDELIFTVPNSELELMIEKLPIIMEKTYNLKVRLASNVTYGKTWYDL